MWSRAFLFYAVFALSFFSAPPNAHALTAEQIAALTCREALLANADREPYQYLFNSEKEAHLWESLIQQEANAAIRGGQFGLSLPPFDIQKQRALAEVILPNSRDAKWMNHLGFVYIPAETGSPAMWEFVGNLGNLPIRIQETLIDQGQKAGLKSVNQMVFLGMMFGNEVDFGKFTDIVTLAPFVDSPPNHLFSKTFQNASMAQQVTVWQWATPVANGRMPFSLPMAYHDTFHFFDYFHEPALMAADRRLFQAIDNQKLKLRSGSPPKIGEIGAEDKRAFYRVHIAREYFSLPNPNHSAAKKLFLQISGKTTAKAFRVLSKLSDVQLQARLGAWLDLDQDAFLNYGAASRDVNCALRQNHRNVVLDLLRDHPNPRWATDLRPQWAGLIEGAEAYLLLHSGQLKALRVLTTGMKEPDKLKEWIKAASANLIADDLHYLTQKDSIRNWILHRLARFEASIGAAIDLDYTIFDLINDIGGDPDRTIPYRLDSKTGQYFAAFAKGTYYETIFLENR